MIFGWLFKEVAEYGRSGRWPAVREAHLEKEPCCAACGRQRDVEVHHIQPYHAAPERELDPTNLISLCRDPCHFVFGHMLHWSRCNPLVREDAARYRERMRQCRALAVGMLSEPARHVPDAWATAYAVTRACEIANHDAAPAAIARTDADRNRTDKAAIRPGEDAGNTPAETNHTQPRTKEPASMSAENEWSVASAGYGWAGRFILSIALAAWIGTGCTQRNVTPPKPKKVVTVCSGCGTEWWSMSGKKPKPITKCPNCPMSEEEFEALKEQMRKRKEKP